MEKKMLDYISHLETLFIYMIKTNNEKEKLIYQRNKTLIEKLAYHGCKPEELVECINKSEPFDRNLEKLSNDFDNDYMINAFNSINEEAFNAYKDSKLMENALLFFEGKHEQMRALGIREGEKNEGSSGNDRSENNNRFN